MERVEFVSSSVKAGAYSLPDLKLYLWFGDDASRQSVYEYLGVPFQIWRQLLEADSKGGFIARSIKGCFDYHLMDDEEVSELNRRLKSVAAKWLEQLTPQHVFNAVI